MGKGKKKGSKKVWGADGVKGMENAVSDDEGDITGDVMYDEVDMWDKEQEEKALAVVMKGRKKKDEGDNEVLALSGTDSDSDLELPTMKKLKKKKAKKAADDMNDSDIGSDENEEEDIRKWGSKKKHFYGGNTGEEMESDLDDSEMEEDKAEEEEAAKLQSRQLDMMNEEDFLDTFIVDNQQKTQKKEETQAPVSSTLLSDISKLSKKEQVALFKQQSPEYDGVTQDFQLKMSEAVKLSRVIALAASGQIPAGPHLDYLRTKLELLLNYTTNILAYLMFKSRGTNLTLHPVTGRLVQYRQLLDSTEHIDKIVMPEVDKILERLDKGDKLVDMIKEERRKQKRKNDLGTTKGKLKTSEKTSKKTDEKKKKRKRKPSEVDNKLGLTNDERMAVDLYQAIKKPKNDDDLESDGDSLDEDFNVDKPDEIDNDEAEEGSVVDQDPGYDDAEEEKRAITYKIAKNKGLMPKRSKLQRNPRVKNRMKFEKAKKRRKGAVREIRDQKQKYGSHNLCTIPVVI